MGSKEIKFRGAIYRQVDGAMDWAAKSNLDDKLSAIVVALELQLRRLDSASDIKSEISVLQDMIERLPKMQEVLSEVTTSAQASLMALQEQEVKAKGPAKELTTSPESNVKQPVVKQRRHRVP